MPGLDGGNYRVKVTSMKEAKTLTTMLQKYDFSCGSAAVATLLTHHYGYPVDEQLVFEQMYARGDQKKIQQEGFSLLDMKNFLDARGFRADGFEQPLEKLAEANVPAIVLITENGYHHFVVVKGVSAERVLIGDPANGTRAMARADFDQRWRNKILFVIHNHMDSASFNLASDWRVAPRGPLADGAARSMSVVGLPKFGPGDF
ncbi:MAG: C39 family peptidase [Janthinobacterium lividum]